ncbi:MAG: hypothetical protein KBA26_12390 [Candidatus Delongbacteria bacterium]|nr:hypothetical protein [Candidatus Delongbacteria bacterium]
MKLVLILYALNASLLILHEIESAYWKEWEILGMKGGITLFTLLHFPLILMMGWGGRLIDHGLWWGKIMGLITGLGGLCPWLVHRMIRRVPDRFNLPLSGLLIYANLITGLGLLISVWVDY